MNKELIYLDNNATTQVDSRVLDAMMPYLTNNFANASSTYKFGTKANDAVKEARDKVANIIGAQSNEIIFTSGATEACNQAIISVSDSYSDKGKHIITVATEHSAVLETCRHLEKKGYEIMYLPVNSDGLIDLDILKSSLRSDTILVSVMLANNETGVIQDIKTISDLAHEVGAIFMSDATQAIGKIPISVDELGIDLLCLSGHKMYAPKGIGALFFRQRNNRVKLLPLIHGGGQERNYRSGTLNVPGIVGLGRACELLKQEMKSNEKTICKFRDYLETELLKIGDVKINGSQEFRLHNTTNLRFNGADSDAILMGLNNIENCQIVVSKGSACGSSNIEPSHVLTAMGLSELEAYSSLRFSLNHCNSINDIRITIKNISSIVSFLRAM